MLIETEPPTKIMHGTDQKFSYTYVTDVQLGLHGGPLTSRARVLSESVADLWIFFP